MIRANVGALIFTSIEVRCKCPNFSNRLLIASASSNREAPNDRYWRFSEVLEYALRFRLCRYTGPFRRVWVTLKMLETDLHELELSA
jgi:hypothetical protein